MSEIDRRIEEVEIKVSFQEDLLAKLDEVLTAMRGEIEELRQDVLALTEAINRGPPEAHAPEDEVPPHY